MADKERRFSWTVQAGDALLLLCATAGLAGSFLSLYGNPDVGWADATALDRCAAKADWFLVYAVLFALVSLAVWSLPRFCYAAAGGLAALWTGVLLFRWTQAVQGAGITVREITTLFSQRVDWGRVFTYETELTWLEEAGAVQAFLLLALAGLALLLGWAVVRTRCWWLALEFTLPFLLPGLLADLYPDWLPFMALAACWCVMMVTGLCKWAAPSGRGKLVLTVFPVVAAVLLLITALFPREGYTRPGWARKAEEELLNLSSHASKLFSRWDGPFQNTVTYVGAAEEADLAHAGPLNYTGRSVLRVKSDYEGWIILRGSSLAVYEDGVWKALPEGTYQEWADELDGKGTADAFQLENGADIYQRGGTVFLPAWSSYVGQTYTITVDNVGAVGACVYAPYFVTDQDWTAAGMLPVEDSYIAREQGQWSHTIEFVDGITLKGGSYLAYNSFVTEHYLDVPEELRAELQILVSESWTEGKLGDYYDYYSSYEPLFPTSGTFTYVQQIADLLDEMCVYDQNAPAPPEGVDPIHYFLSESHRGYCMHYTSAAVMLLRTIGIPARYVSGFAMEIEADRQMTVPDRAAHAWVEVWLEGVGWYPMNVTPAAAFEWTQQGELDAEDPLDATPEPTAEPTAAPESTAAPEITAAPEDGDGPGEAVRDWTALLAVLKVLAGLAGGVFLLWLVQFAAKRLRVRRMAGPDANRAALACYGCLCRLERWGGRIDQRAVELAEKARFSQHTLTEQELVLLRAMVDRERTRLCVMPGRARRLAFRYLWGMPKQPVFQADDGPASDET